MSVNYAAGGMELMDAWLKLVRLWVLSQLNPLVLAIAWVIDISESRRTAVRTQHSGSAPNVNNESAQALACAGPPMWHSAAASIQQTCGGP